MRSIGSRPGLGADRSRRRVPAYPRTVVARPPTGSIPETPGSYQFKDALGRVIYVGKASNLRQRLSNYFQDPRNLHARTAQMVARLELDFDPGRVDALGNGLFLLNARKDAADTLHVLDARQLAVYFIPAQDLGSVANLED